METVIYKKNFLKLIFHFNLLILLEAKVNASFGLESLCIDTPYTQITRPFDLMSSINIGRPLDFYIPWFELFKEHKDGIIVKISKKTFQLSNGSIVSNYQFFLPIEDSQAIAYLYIKKDDLTGLFKTCDVTATINFELENNPELLKYMYQTLYRFIFKKTCITDDNLQISFLKMLANCNKQFYETRKLKCIKSTIDESDLIYQHIQDPEEIIKSDLKLIDEFKQSEQYDFQEDQIDIENNEDDLSKDIFHSIEESTEDTKKISLNDAFKKLNQEDSVINIFDKLSIIKSLIQNQIYDIDLFYVGEMLTFSESKNFKFHTKEEKEIILKLFLEISEYLKIDELQKIFRKKIIKLNLDEKPKVKHDLFNLSKKVIIEKTEIKSKPKKLKSISKASKKDSDEDVLNQELSKLQTLKDSGEGQKLEISKIVNKLSDYKKNIVKSFFTKKISIKDNEYKAMCLELEAVFKQIKPRQIALLTPEVIKSLDILIASVLITKNINFTDQHIITTLENFKSFFDILKTIPSFILDSKEMLEKLNYLMFFFLRSNITEINENYSRFEFFFNNNEVIKTALSVINLEIKSEAKVVDRYSSDEKTEFFIKDIFRLSEEEFNKIESSASELERNQLDNFIKLISKYAYFSSIRFEKYTKNDDNDIELRLSLYNQMLKLSIQLLNNSFKSRYIAKLTMRNEFFIYDILSPMIIALQILMRDCQKESLIKLKIQMFYLDFLIKMKKFDLLLLFEEEIEFPFFEYRSKL